MSMHLYRGFEIYPLIYAHTQTTDGASRNYDDGFDAAVKICLRDTDTALTCSDTYKLDESPPFSTAGAARRASLEYAKGLIDRHGGENWMLP
ncbi:hypothetical protein WT60_26330 [Burkholderia sp. MSMB617WGS]|uniref:hypothetical protein n=1 Tax=Burkholderia TaxID=32008 RepID=UPI0005317AA2|nr:MULTISPECIES: hypothetical protein [Burkholderia]AOK50339.1 hypothetical protein WT60_26330 [Burkholderia sp. MSMB617WGS]KGS02491.1 hypothetical protein X946_3401 [Burkholderia sp. ABCPW 111]KWZ47375.1 hypothetical protein WS73_01935 [Burkholderia savannae]